MKKSTYGLIVLVALTMSFPLLFSTAAPVLAAAESEYGEHEGNDANEREAGEHEANEAERSESEENEGNALGSATSNIILFVTLVAIAGVGGYSAFKVYQARKRATKKLV